jgi:hypothetical protein
MICFIKSHRKIGARAAECPCGDDFSRRAVEYINYVICRWDIDVDSLCCFVQLEGFGMGREFDGSYQVSCRTVQKGYTCIRPISVANKNLVRSRVVAAVVGITRSCTVLRNLYVLPSNMRTVPSSPFAMKIRADLET